MTWVFGDEDDMVTYGDVDVEDDEYYKDDEDEGDDEDDKDDGDDEAVWLVGWRPQHPLCSLHSLSSFYHLH